MNPLVFSENKPSAWRQASHRKSVLCSVGVYIYIYISLKCIRYHLSKYEFFFYIQLQPQHTVHSVVVYCSYKSRTQTHGYQTGSIQFGM